MKIGLIDCDGHNYPNIPLMKISAWHKSKGDEVMWYDIFTGHCDKVYISKVFSFSPDYQFAIDADEVIRGGSGYAIKNINGKEVYDETIDKPLPTEIQKMFPDYSIYPQYTKDTAFGFITRGCPRDCSFCHTTQMQGAKVHKVAELSEFWNGQKNIVLFDPNITAYKDCESVFEELIATKANIEFNQGLDVRLLTKRKCELLSKMKLKNLHFAFDRYQDWDMITPKFEMLYQFFKAHKRRTKDISVYVLTNFDTTLEQDLKRIMFLRGLGYSPYVMIYNKDKCGKVYKHLQRWVNNRFVFWACETFNDYCKNINFVINEEL